MIRNKIRTHLQNGEILQNTVHHVLLRQVLQLVYEIDHVLAHRRPVYPVHEPAVLQSRILRLHLLHDLLAERTDLGRTRDRHVLTAVISAKDKTPDYLETPSQLT